VSTAPAAALKKGYSPFGGGQDDGAGSGGDILTLDFPQAVFPEQPAQSSPLEEVAAVPEMPAPGQTFDGRNIEISESGSPVPGLFEVDEDDPSVGERRAFASASNRGRKSALFSSEAKETTMPRKVAGRTVSGRVRANKWNAQAPGGGVLEQPDVDIDPYGFPARLPHESGLVPGRQHRSGAGNRSLLSARFRTFSRIPRRGPQAPPV